jgi:zinc protease
VVVLVAERPGLPIVTVRVAVQAGAVLDPPDKAGLANLTALLLVRGTRSRAALDIDRAIEFVGGTLESEGGRDASEITLSVLRKDLSLGLDLLADVLLRPAFPPAEVERTRDEILASVRRAEEDPAVVAGRRLRRAAFPGHPYGWPVQGTEASLPGITREDVVAFHEAAYRPEATIVALAGAITATEAHAELLARLGGWRAARPAPALPVPAPAAAAPRIETVARALTQATLVLGRSTVARHHADHVPLAVAAHVLGGGAASRLYTRVREERGLAYNVYASHAPARWGGLVLVEAQCDHARVREVLALVREEVSRLRREPVPDEELARAKAYLTGSFAFRMATASALTDLLLSVEQHGLGLDYPETRRRAILAVTAEDVRRAVRTHWDPDAMSLVVVANLREAGLE